MKWHRYLPALVLCSLLFGLLFHASAAPPAATPNVVILYTDDQGTLDANCYGSSDLITPTMDRLAASGVRFTQMYAPSAICSASRAGLMTGRFPARAGVPANVSSDHGRPGMPASEITIAEMLRSQGYATAHIGKWHLGYTPETMPNGQGFDYSFGHMGGCIDNYSHFFYWNGPNRHDLWKNGKQVWHDGEYFGDLMLNECKQFITAHRAQRFFVYMAINWPHYPLQGSAKWRAAYSGRGLKHPRDKYAIFVSTLDEVMGKVIAHLEELGLRDQTLVIFQSDHGHSVEERAFFGGGNPGPYRGAKSSLFEGGLRVPSIVSLPGVIPEGEVRDQLVTGCDWLPTIAAYTGAPLPQHHLDGRNIRPVIESAEAPSPHNEFYWLLGRGDSARWAVRQGDWKLLGNPRDPRNPESITEADKLFLANLKTDPGEKTNQAHDHPELVKKLHAVHEWNLKSIAGER